MSHGTLVSEQAVICTYCNLPTHKGCKSHRHCTQVQRMSGKKLGRYVGEIVARILIAGRVEA